MLGTIVKHDGNKLTIEFENEINAEYLKMLAREKENLVKVKLLDNEAMSAKQNALSHALIKDIALDYGDFPVKAVEEDVLKYMYEVKDEYGFEHTNATKDEATKWIDFLIEYVLWKKVPLENRYEYLLENDRFFYFCCKYRSCCVCGRPHAQIHHVSAVGNRKRNEVDHRQFPMASLCWEHHNIAHNMGQTKFLEDFKIIPVFLDKEALIKIGVMSNSQIMRFDKEYENEELFEKAIAEKAGS